MSIFGNIVSAILHQAAPAAAPAPAAAGPAPHSAAVAPSSINNVDVEAVLDKLAKDHRERLDWRHSIVDLLKLLNLDSSLTARKHLASELHYPGDAGESAAMNIWLHAEVMTELAKNGGKVPDDLKH